MKSGINTFPRWTAALPALIVAGLLPLSAAPASGPAKLPKPEVPQSVFTLPTNPSQGRDPFFPDSTRPYAEAQPSHPSRGPAITSLVLQGISDNGKRAFAIINNETFGVGETGTVVTSEGRLQIQCVEINSDSVKVEAKGQHLQLFLSNKP